MLPLRFRSGNIACSVRSMLLPQVRLDDLDGDRSSGCGTEPTTLHDDSNSDRRAGCWREAGEHGVVEAGVVGAVLGRTGLARYVDAASHAWVGGEERGASRVVGHALHHRG